MQIKAFKDNNRVFRAISLAVIERSDLMKFITAFLKADYKEMSKLINLLLDRRLLEDVGIGQIHPIDKYLEVFMNKAMEYDCNIILMDDLHDMFYKPSTKYFIGKGKTYQKKLRHMTLSSIYNYMNVKNICDYSMNAR